MPEEKSRAVSLLNARFNIHECIQLIAKIAGDHFDDYSPSDLNEIVNAIGKLVEIRKELIIIINSQLQKQSASFDHIGKFTAINANKSLNVSIEHLPITQMHQR